MAGKRQGAVVEAEEGCIMCIFLQSYLNCNRKRTFK